MKFGENLKIIRNQKNISQEELAEKIGVSRQSISKWETGENFPSMNNIMCLCKVFECKINDLVHENFTDIDSFDDEIKENIVKFKKEKQVKVKLISKIIYTISNIIKKLISIFIIILLIVVISLPFIVASIDTKTQDTIINNIKQISNLNEIGNTIISYYNTHSITQIVIHTEIILIGSIISFIFLKKVFENMYKLFLNIYNGDTPFTIDNINCMKKISYFIIIYILCSYLYGIFCELITDIDLDVGLELIDILYAMIIYGVSFIFEYGYELQLDSKSRMLDKTA